MTEDLHSHTYYSFCGKDRPEQIVEAAIAGGIDLFGISDHCHGVVNGRISVYRSEDETITRDAERTLRQYYDHINLIREKYADKITVLRGLELNTLREKRLPLTDADDVSFFDYCLIEQLDAGDLSVTGGDLFPFAKRLGCPVGIAHTDLFAHIGKRCEDPSDYFKRMADAGIFWEMNVTYDSIHEYRIHPYMVRFFDSPEQQDIVRRSGAKISIGFDGHRVEDYLPERIREYCAKAEALGLPLQFAELAKKPENTK